MKSINNLPLTITQKNVDVMAKALGGYWPPLSAIARVLEELGELGDLILKKQYDEDFANELSDVVVITLCIANQYCSIIRFSKQPASKEELNIESLYFKLVSDCGELARIINAYEGSKKLKPQENPKTVEKQTSLIFTDLLKIAVLNKIDLLSVVDNTLTKVTKRDIKRFDTIYDPVSTSSHEDYITVFSSKVKVWGLRESLGRSLVEDLDCNADTVKRFLKFGEIEGIKKLVFRLPNGNYNKVLGDYEKVLNVVTNKDFAVITKA